MSQLNGQLYLIYLLGVTCCDLCNPSPPGQAASRRCCSESLPHRQRSRPRSPLACGPPCRFLGCPGHTPHRPTGWRSRPGSCILFLSSSLVVTVLRQWHQWMLRRRGQQVSCRNAAGRWSGGRGGHPLGRALPLPHSLQAGGQQPQGAADCGPNPSRVPAPR